MTQPRRGWTLAVGAHPAAAVEAMPKELQRAVLNFLSALALEAGSAIDAGKPPPGQRLDEVGLRYSIVVQGEPVIVEYLALRAARELRAAALVWLH
ncbi:hypothetical protein OG552_00165 [Streptomyces sp. NBC_01476]|uniref:hypothetical protein n=1 Tax=Streptomyces sp. NBC_01476 TaxID=2903881 RepID=UPI002E35F661|nr:hypothetical protein [Streptomyces sp. NBC_01476]